MLIWVPTEGHSIHQSSDLGVHGNPFGSAGRELMWERVPFMKVRCGLPQQNSTVPLVKFHINSPRWINNKSSNKPIVSIPEHCPWTGLQLSAAGRWECHVTPSIPH